MIRFCSFLKSAGCGLIILFIGYSSSAQSATIPRIPESWPLHIQNSMNAKREILIKRINEYDKRVNSFNTRCASSPIPPDNKAEISYCQGESAALDAEGNAIDKERESFLFFFHDYENIYAAYIQSKINEKILEAVKKDSVAYSRQLQKLVSDISRIKVPPPSAPHKIHEGVILGLFNTDEINAITDTSKHVVSPYTGKEYKKDEFFATSDRVSVKELYRGLMDNNYLGEYTLNTEHGKKLIERLEGTQFDRLIAHSNGATVAEALIRKGVIQVDELNIIGGDRSLINQISYMELIATGKVKRVVVWTNPGDVIPLGSSAAVLMSPIVVAKEQYIDMASSYLSTLLTGQNKGGDTKVEYRSLQGEQYGGQKMNLGKNLFQSHGLEVYLKNIKEYLKGG